MALATGYVNGYKASTGLESLMKLPANLQAGWLVQNAASLVQALVGTMDGNYPPWHTLYTFASPRKSVEMLLQEKLQAAVVATIAAANYYFTPGIDAVTPTKVATDKWSAILNGGNALPAELRLSAEKLVAILNSISVTAVLEGRGPKAATQTTITAAPILPKVTIDPAALKVIANTIPAASTTTVKETVKREVPLSTLYPEKPKRELPIETRTTVKESEKPPEAIRLLLTTETTTTTEVKPPVVETTEVKADTKKGLRKIPSWAYVAAGGAALVLLALLVGGSRD